MNMNVSALLLITVLVAGAGTVAPAATSPAVGDVSGLGGDSLLPQQTYAHGLRPAEALKALQVPKGFTADLVAAEPEIVQPIAFTFDARGRIWVVEGMSYPQPRKPGEGLDRIVILEDKDGDGVFETRKVFCEGISLASGIELGFGGVWVGAAPYLMFIPDKDGDDRPDVEDAACAGYEKVPGLNFTAYALLDGWGAQDTHETLNSFIWGPDGWLYGCHGVFTHSRVGKPGMPDEQRQPINAGVWRFNPVSRTFEVFAHGTSNPWGLDYNKDGEFMVTSCVIPHLYHIVPGGRYTRQAGQHFNAHTYEDIKTVADHSHFAGAPRPTIGHNAVTGAGVVDEDTNALGGGHAHCGLAIYQSGLFPEAYRNQLIFGNLHGHRLVSDYLEPNGSSYKGKHGRDFMRSNDMHFIPVTQKVGPDGALYVSDWSDQQICHRGSNAVENWDRTNGRVFRIRYDGWKPWKRDLAKESIAALMELSLQTNNDWESRTARRLLQERVLVAKDVEAMNAVRSLGAGVVLNNASSEERRLRALWVVGACGAFDVNTGEKLLAEGSGLLKVWAARLMEGDAGGTSQKLALVAATESAAPVRRELASALLRIPLGERKALAIALLGHAEDRDDAYIPLLVWYGIEPLVGSDPVAGLEMAGISKLPKVTEFIYRRLSSEPKGRNFVLNELVGERDPLKRELALSLVLGSAGTGGKLEAPAKWESTRNRLLDGASARTVEIVEELSALFGDAAAQEKFRRVFVLDENDSKTRTHALAVLLQADATVTGPLALEVVNRRQTPSDLRRKAIQALGTWRPPETSDALLRLLPSMNGLEQTDALNTLASYPEGALALMKAVAAKKVEARLLSPFLVRQLQSLHSKEVEDLFPEVLGTVNAGKADMPQQRAKYISLLKADKLRNADLQHGRALFNASCGLCHKLFGEGQSVGPELTGSNRGNLEYLLDNVLDPNALIGRDYQLNILTMKDGRVMSGIVKGETDALYTLVLPGGVEFAVQKGEVKAREVSKVSMMPEGLFDAMQPDHVVDLVAYLQSNTVSSASANKVEGVLEAETLGITATGGRFTPQAMGHFRAGVWSGGRHLWWTGAKTGDALALEFPVHKPGRQRLLAAFTKAPDYAKVSLKVDGREVRIRELDLYDPTVTNTEELNLGEFDFTAGQHRLEVTVSGRNPAAKPSMMVGIDYLRLVQP
jgi:putative membrane-bound dehydrogenase-like protein